MKIQSTGWCSRRLDSREVSFEENLFVFQALPTQGPLDPICLGSKVRISEKELGFLIGLDYRV
jgi:hypothetical protein